MTNRSEETEKNLRSFNCRQASITFKNKEKNVKLKNNEKKNINHIVIEIKGKTGHLDI